MNRRTLGLALAAATIAGLGPARVYRRELTVR